jgi:hypothetical protein
MKPFNIQACGGDTDNFGHSEPENKSAFRKGHVDETHMAINDVIGL